MLGNSIAPLWKGKICQFDTLECFPADRLSAGAVLINGTAVCCFPATPVSGESLSKSLPGVRVTTFYSKGFKDVKRTRRTDANKKHQIAIRCQLNCIPRTLELLERGIARYHQQMRDENPTLDRDWTMSIPYRVLFSSGFRTLILCLQHPLASFYCNQYNH